MKFYSSNEKITEAMVKEATTVTINPTYTVGMDNKPINWVLFNNIGWFVFDTTAYVITEEGCYNIYGSTLTNKHYKVEA